MKASTEFKPCMYVGLQVVSCATYINDKQVVVCSDSSVGRMNINMHESSSEFKLLRMTEFERKR